MVIHTISYQIKARMKPYLTLNHFLKKHGAAILMLMALMLMVSQSLAVAQSLVYPKVTETYIGANFMQDIDNRMAAHKDAGSFATRNTDQARAFMVRWGYREERTYGIELGYMFMPAWEGKSSNGSVLSYKGNGFFADIFLFFPMTSAASIYLKMGTARLLGTSSVAIPNTVTNGGYKREVEEYNWSASTGIGLEYQLDPGFAIRAGWESLKTKGVDGVTSKHGGFNVGGLLFYE